MINFGSLQLFNFDRALASDEVLKQLRAQPEAWRHVHLILENSGDANTKFFALTVLSETIATRWKILPQEERSGIKAYVVQLLITISADENHAASQKHFLTKLNETLLQIVKQEWCAFVLCTSSAVQ